MNNSDNKLLTNHSQSNAEMHYEFVEAPEADGYYKLWRYFPKYWNNTYSSSICPGGDEKENFLITKL